MSSNLRSPNLMPVAVVATRGRASLPAGTSAPAESKSNSARATTEPPLGTWVSLACGPPVALETAKRLHEVAAAYGAVAALREGEVKRVVSRIFPEAVRA